jgi:hypothetical protein
MKKITLVLFLTSLATHASCPDQVQLLSMNNKVTFCQTQDGSLISKNCFEDKRCNWKEELETIRKIRLTEGQLVMGKNPNSVKCTVAGKVVHLFRDQKNNEQTFCEISTGHFLDVASFD